MELIQSHIPDIPVWKPKSIINTQDTTGGIIDFFSKNWLWILLIVAIAGGGLIWWLSSSQKPIENKFKEEQVPTPNLNSPNPQNPFRNV